MDTFGTFTFTASAEPEPTASEAVPPSAPDAAKRKSGKKRLRPWLDQDSRLGHIAAAAVVALIFAVAAAWDRLPKQGSRPAFAAPSRAVPVGPSVPYLRAAHAGGVSNFRPPSRPGGFALSDELPDYGGARTPSLGDDFELDLLEEDVRERLRSKGKLPSDPLGLDGLGDELKSSRDSLFRFANWKGR